MVVAPTLIPSFLSSPWTRMHPQLRFSRPRRTMSSKVDSGSAGRPPLCRFRHPPPPALGGLPVPTHERCWRHEER